MNHGLRLGWLAAVTLVIVTTLVLLIWRSWPDGNLHLIFCDVGQGEGIIITYGFTQIVVDGGPDETIFLSCLRSHLPFWDRTIELMVPTHFDKDHIAGLTEVLRRYQVDELVMPQDSRETAEFTRFKSAVIEEQQRGLRLRPVWCQPMIELGAAAQLRFLTAAPIAPERHAELCGSNTETLLWDGQFIFSPGIAQSYLEANDRSTVLSIQAGRYGFLLTGDLESAGESALLSSGLVKQMTVLKVGHHGSKSGTSVPFIQVVQPELAVISVGKNNAFGHPSTAVLDRLQQAGVKTVLRTDQLGSIELVTDGARLWQAKTTALESHKNY